MADEIEGVSAWGLVETRYRNWFSELGQLSARQIAIAEQIYRLASLLDKEDAAGTQAAALSRELRQLVAEFREAAVPAAGTPAAPTNSMDEVARKRNERRQSKEGSA